MRNNKILTAPGFMDIMPKDLEIKTHIKNKIKNSFKSFSYQMIESPMLEHIDVYLNESENNYMYKLIDREGNTLVLRPDLTPPIARIVASHYENYSFPLRISYIGKTFKYNESYQGKQREISQAGVELVGKKSVKADSEVIALAISSLLSTGIENIILEIGHVDFLQGILEDSKLEQNQIESVLNYISNREYIEVEQFITFHELDEDAKHVLTNLHNLVGDFELLEKAKSLAKNKKSIDAINWLEGVYSHLVDYGYEKYLSFDLGLLQKREYYTDIVFRAYTYALGFSILDGGRYDNLMSKYGKDRPSIGFTISIENIISAINRQDIDIVDEKNTIILSYEEKARKFAFRTAEVLRNAGLCIENSLYDSIDENIIYAKENKISSIIHFLSENKIELINSCDKSREVLDLSTLMNRYT